MSLSELLTMHRRLREERAALPESISPGTALALETAALVIPEERVPVSMERLSVPESASAPAERAAFNPAMQSGFAPSRQSALEPPAQADFTPQKQSAHDLSVQADFVSVSRIAFDPPGLDYPASSATSTAREDDPEERFIRRISWDERRRPQDMEADLA